MTEPRQFDRLRRHASTHGSTRATIAGWVLGLACAIGGVGLPSNADAIPAFARRYQTSCTTCHVLIPKLNAFGMAFRNRGFRIPPRDADYVRTPDVALGAPGWRRLWPEDIWPGALPGMPPVAFRIMADAVADPSETVKLNFDFPHEFEILMGGTAGEHVSYWGEIEISGDGEVELSRAYLQFDQLGGTTLANLLIGRFEPRAVPFSRFWRRLTVSDTIPTLHQPVAGGFDFEQRQAGLEFWGARTGGNGRGGLEYAVGVVNGNGPGGDNNTAKDVYYRASYKLGGFGVTGTTGGQVSMPSPQRWQDDSIRFGTFAYRGSGLFNGIEDRFWRVGGDVDLWIHNLNLFGAAWHGNDRLAAGPSADLTGTTAFVEAQYVIKPWIIGILRYGTAVSGQQQEIRRVVAAVPIAIRANVRLVTEHEHYLEESGNTRTVVRLDFAF